MCLIINRPAGGTIPPAYLKNAIARNPDGWGIMRASKGRILTTKGFGLDGLVKSLASSGKGALSVHLRYGTHGPKNIDNCHPFPMLGGRFALMHNGIIPGEVIDPLRSDTWHFAKYVLEPLLQADPTYFDHHAFEPYLGQTIGIANKLVILRADGKCVTVNAELGDTRDGLWLSNTYSVEPPAPAQSAWEKWAHWKRQDAKRPRDVSPLELDDTDFEIGYHDEIPCAPYNVWDAMDADLDREDWVELMQADPEGCADVIMEALEKIQRYTCAG